MGSKVDIKCVMIGNASVGKSSLMERYLYDKFNDKISTTVGAAFAAKEVESTRKPGVKAVVGLWDTAGSERYESMTRHYFQGAAAAVVCYDVTDERSWTKVQQWVKDVKDVEEKCIVVLVACKTDLLTGNAAKSRAVSKNVVENYATKLGAKNFECSALSGVGCNSPFQSVVDEWLETNTPKGTGGHGGQDKGKKNRTVLSGWIRRRNPVCSMAVVVDEEKEVDRDSCGERAVRKVEAKRFKKGNFCSVLSQSVVSLSSVLILLFLLELHYSA